MNIINTSGNHNYGLTDRFFTDCLIVLWCIVLYLKELAELYLKTNKQKKPFIILTGYHLSGTLGQITDRCGNFVRHAPTKTLIKTELNTLDFKVQV